MYIVYDNCVNQGKITATNDSVNFPVMNLADQRLSRFFRSTAGNTDIHIASDSLFDTIVFYKHNLGFNTTLSITLLGDTFSVDLTKSSIKGSGYYILIYDEMILVRLETLNVYTAVLSASDRVEEYTYIDQGLENERVQTIVYSSAGLKAAFKETYEYMIVEGRYVVYRQTRELITDDPYGGIEIDISISDPTLSNIEIKCLYVGQYLKINNPRQNQKIEYVHETNIQRSTTGHVYGEVLYKYKKVKVKLPAMTQSDASDFVEFWDAVSNVKYCFLIVWDDATQFFNPVYCRLDQKKFELQNNAKLFFPFSTDLEFEEGF